MTSTVSTPTPAIPAARQTPADALRLAGHVPVLDGLRGVAILLVLLRHFTPQGEGHSFIGEVVRGVASVGGAGVDLFFVLSGFLITGILLDAKGTPHFFRNFYARRTLRIFPLYYGVLFACFVVAPLVHPFGPAEQPVAHRQAWLWFYGTNIRESFVDAGHAFSGGWISMDHFWSLAVEEHFYLVWPLLVWLFPRRAMTWACCACIAAAVVLRVIIYRSDVPTMAYYHLTPCRVDELAVGGLLALLARSRSAGARLTTLAPWLLPLPLIVLFLTRRHEWQEEVLRGSMLAAFFAALLVTAITRPASSPLTRLLDNRPLRLMGKYSYATYVLHPLLLNAFITPYLSYQRLGALTHSGVLGVCLYLLIGISLSVAAAWISWHVFEKHFLRLKRYFDYHSKAATEGTS